ncbi:MAG: serine acetyltransferase [Bacteroidota bacterium]
MIQMIGEMNYREKVEMFFKRTLDTLYPIRLGIREVEDSNLDVLKEILCDLLDQNIEEYKGNQNELLEALPSALIEIKAKLNKDIEAIYKGDPACTSYNEVIIAYPGFYATAAYRIGHFLLNQGVALIPRIITEHAHSYSGIDIHPGAKIGTHLCIDHGTGVVIGETAVIGNHVKIYQGVTLGALSVTDKNAIGQRHPTIEDDVVIYAQATILGGETVIGRGSIIGGNVWITKSIEPFSKIYYRSPRDLRDDFENRFRA